MKMAQQIFEDFPVFDILGDYLLRRYSWQTEMW